MLVVTFFLAVMFAIAFGGSAASADNLMAQVKLPKQYTIVYKVKVVDTSTLEALQDKVRSIKESVQKAINLHVINSNEASLQIREQISNAQKQRSVAAANSNHWYFVTVSSDGNHFLCYSRSQRDSTQIVSIYSNALNATYFYVRGKGAPEYGLSSGDNLDIDSGFNQSTDILMPLLGFDDPQSDFYFIKNEILEEQPHSNLAVWRGESPIVINEYAYMEQPGYSSSQCEVERMGNTSFVQHCSVYYTDGYIYNDWHYSNPTKLSSSEIPGEIEMDFSRPVWVGGKWKHHPASRLIYSLISAVSTPVKLSQFEIENWMPEGQPCQVRNTAFVKQAGKLMVFSFVPGVMPLKEAIAQQNAELFGPHTIVDAKSTNRRLPYMIVGFVLICLGGWIVRRQYLNRSLRHG